MTGFGLIAAVLMAILSTAYLKQLPGKKEIAQLEQDLRKKYGAYLDPEAPIKVRLVQPAKRGEKMSLSIQCVARKALRAKKPVVIESALDEIALHSLRHPKWRGKVGAVVVIHDAKPRVERRLDAKRAGDRPETVSHGSLRPAKGKG